VPGGSFHLRDLAEYTRHLCVRARTDRQSRANAMILTRDYIQPVAGRLITITAEIGNTIRRSVFTDVYPVTQFELLPQKCPLDCRPTNNRTGRPAVRLPSAKQPCELTAGLQFLNYEALTLA
jgi:hypothetical protein